MRSRVDELFNDRCKPKPKIHIKLWDTVKEPYPEESEEEINSIDIYVHLVV
jgi:hypothetical protein